MSALKLIREYVAKTRAEGNEVRNIEINKKLAGQLAKEIGDISTLDGLPVIVLDDREECLAKGVVYCDLRWDVQVAVESVALLAGAIPTEELMSLLPLIIDQHVDSLDIDDPSVEWDQVEIDQIKEELAEMGFEGVEI